MGLLTLIQRLRRAGPRGEAEPRPAGELSQLAWESIYHRGVIDEALADEMLRRLEGVFSRLSSDRNWFVALYLLCSPYDRSSFNSWEVRTEIKRMMASLFWKEAGGQWGGGLSRAELAERALREWGCTLELPDETAPFRCRLQKPAVANGAADWFSADAEVYLSEGHTDVTTRGKLALLTRALPVAGDAEPLRGVLLCESGVAVAPHLDLSQRGARGRTNHVYLTETNTELLIGPHPGCDLLSETLPSAHWIKCDPAAGDISGGSDLHLRYSDSGTAGLGRHSRFGDVLRERAQQTDFSVRVVGRVLPRADDDFARGYGEDWCELSSPDLRVRVSLRLAGNALIAADETGVVFLWNESDRTRRDVTDGQLIEAGGKRYRWQADAAGAFYGSLLFEDQDARLRSQRIPADVAWGGVITRGGSLVDGKVPLLAEHCDDELISRRGSVIVESDGEGSFSLGVVASATQRNLFVLRGSGWGCIRLADASETMTLRPPCEFVYGSTRFSLARNGRAYTLRLHWSGLYDVLD